VSVVRHYRVPHGSTYNVAHGKNVDLLITFVIVGMVTGMEICEFFIHLFSDWTKVRTRETEQSSLRFDFISSVINDHRYLPIWLMVAVAETILFCSGLYIQQRLLLK
jgi:hypothetical protein